MLESPRGGTSVLKRCNLSEKGGIAAKFAILRNNLKNCANLTSHSASKLAEDGGLTHSVDLTFIKDTSQAGVLAPHPDLEKGKDANPGTLLGNHFENAKVNNAVFTPQPDALKDGKGIIAAQNPTPSSTWWKRMLRKRKVKRINQKLTNFRDQRAISKCILENLQKELMSTKDHLEPSPPQTAKPNEQQQTAVERSEQAALLSCQVSEGGLFWGEARFPHGPKL